MSSNHGKFPPAGLRATSGAGKLSMFWRHSWASRHDSRDLWTSVANPSIPYLSLWNIKKAGLNSSNVLKIGESVSHYVICTWYTACYYEMHHILLHYHNSVMISHEWYCDSARRQNVLGARYGSNFGIIITDNIILSQQPSVLLELWLEKRLSASPPLCSFQAANS